jgi:3-dehydroquinate dehydratase / shikimate dehydrogenase
VDLLELRVDRLSPAERGRAGRLPRMVDLPVVLTVRRRDDGGAFEGDERERCALLELHVGSGFAYIDIEEDLHSTRLNELIDAAHVRVIRSFHDFSGVPSDLGRRVERLAHRPGEIPKAAVTPRSCAELAALLRVMVDRQRRPGSWAGSQSVLLGMGEIGFPTRALASKLGSAWCYASPVPDGAAPGQVDPATLEDVYRFRSIGPGTEVLGVIGNPVAHSRSPLIHNRGLAALGIDAVYLPFPVTDLDNFWEVAELLGIRGLSVTIPHKQAVLQRLSSFDALVQTTGACNTITRTQAPGGWHGTNTDVAGFLEPLREAFGGRLPPSLGATVIGAGGAARSVIQALAGERARVLVLNRTPEHARAIAEPLGARYGGLDSDGMMASESYSDLIVQTTSAGMAPNLEADPAPQLRFTGKELVYELIYAPRETRFVRRALKAGCGVVYGRQMLISQAKEQFRLFTGVAYPAEALNGLEREID